MVLKEFINKISKFIIEKKAPTILLMKDASTSEMVVLFNGQPLDFFGLTMELSEKSEEAFKMLLVSMLATVTVENKHDILAQAYELADGLSKLYEEAEDKKNRKK